MRRVKNLFISILSFVLGIYFLYVGVDMTKKYGFSIFEDGGNPIITGQRRFERLGEFISGYMVAIGGCVSGFIHAYLFVKNEDDET